MLRKNIVKLYMISLLLCMFFCGCSKENSDNNKTADNVASSTDSVIENTNIASVDNVYNSENTSNTTESFTSGGIETESGNAIKDDDITNNDNKPNNGGNAGNSTTDGGNKPQNTSQSTTEGSKPSNTTSASEPTPGTIEWYQYTYGENWAFYYYEVDGHKTDNETTTTTTTEATTETISVENCTHPWDKRKWGGYMDVHYEGVYEEQLVCVQEAYDEKVYEYHNFCNGCGVDLDLLAVELGYGRIYGGASPAMIGHACYWSEAWQEYTYASYHCAETVVDTIHHEAIYEMQDVCISPEWGIIYAVEICNVCGGEVKYEHSTYYGEESDFAWYNDPYVP